jgi:hypothetical protein
MNEIEDKESMEQEKILMKLLDNLKMIQAIKMDDGYLMNRVVGIGNGSIELLKQLETDDKDQQVLIKEAVARLNEIDSIYDRYLNHQDYKKFIQKQSSHGNMDLFMKGIRCVEGALEIFLSRIGWYIKKHI